MDLPRWPAPLLLPVALGLLDQAFQLPGQDLLAGGAYVLVADDTLVVDQEQRRPLGNGPARGNGALTSAFLEGTPADVLLRVDGLAPFQERVAVDIKQGEGPAAELL